MALGQTSRWGQNDWGKTGLLVQPVQRVQATWGAGVMMAVGRPSKYQPAYCDEIIEFMGQGYSLTAFAGEIGVNPDTIYEWQRVHPVFSEAVKIAKAKRVRALETGLLSAELGPQVTARIFALKNAAPDEWADKQQVEHTHRVTDERREEVAARLGLDPTRLLADGRIVDADYEEVENAGGE